MKPTFATLADVERHLADHTDYEKMARFAYHERAFNLDRTRRLLERLGNPERAFRAVHVAGTKGKGSVCHMIETVLRGHGLSTGLFTSPHLVSLAERVRLDGRPAPEADLCAGMARVAAACATPGPAGEEPPTFFERIFALACLLFAERGAAWAVMETGLGGRLDATNVLHPRACVITRLALDHTHVLGNTLEEIASEKAGILEKGVPAVVAEQPPEALRVVERAADGVGAPLWRVGREIAFETRERADGRFGIELDVKTPRGDFDRLPLGLAGWHQAGNAAAAVGATALLAAETGTAPDPATLRGRLDALRLPGRLEKVRENPPTIVDVAHNAASMETSLRALDAFFPRERLVAVAGFSRDKDVSAALAPLASRAASLFLTSSGNARAAAPEDLEAEARKRGAGDVKAFEDAVEALDASAASCKPGDLLLITGSFYLAGKALRHLGVDVR